MTVPTEDYVRRAHVDRVIDGDTVDLTVDLGWHTYTSIRLRLEGINAPELRPRRDSHPNEESRHAEMEAARFARAFASAWIEDHGGADDDWPIVLLSTSLDRHAGSFGRSLGDLIDPQTGQRLTHALVDSGHAQRSDQ